MTSSELVSIAQSYYLDQSELYLRRMARQGLIPFTEFTLSYYKPANHHRLIAERLEAVERGEIKRLMIFMPPRHGKSELASKRFPAWYLGRNPDKQIIAASYNSELSTDFGREVRNIVGSPEYSKLFNVTLAADSQAADRWHTNIGGAYVSAGVGTAITGRGANILLIDDPFKDRQEADSETTRDRVWAWYTSTAYTRLMPGGSIVLIQTRWHEDDLAGRLLYAQGRGGDKWQVLSLSALTNNQPLWPEWYGIDALERIRAVIGPRDWGSLYQQEPLPEGGQYFMRDWFRYYDEQPKHLRIFCASDYAVSAAENDYTVHLVAGVDEHEDLYLLDIWREQATSDVWVEKALDLASTWKPIQWAEENGQIIKGVGPFMDRRQRERKVWFYREQYTSSVDKAIRARSIQARMSMGKVYLPRNAPWLSDFERELLSFPAGKHDDQVDAFSLLGRMLANMSAAQVPKAMEPARFPLDRTFNELVKSIGRKRQEE